MDAKPAPDPTLAELREDYLAAMENLDTAAKRAAIAVQKYNAAQHRAQLARHELWEREHEYKVV